MNDTTVKPMTNSYYISTEKSKLDIDMIHDYLCNRSYWAKGRKKENVEKCIRNSMCFGVYAYNHRQAGFARVVSDCTVFAWLLDVFILEEHRGAGLGKQLIQEIVSHPDLCTVRRWMLGTKDAHGLYKQFGFTAIAEPMRLMEKFNIT